MSIFRFRAWVLIGAVLLGSCARVRHDSLGSVPAEPKEDSPFEAADYFRQQRVNGDEQLPVERYLEAQRRVRGMRRYSLPAGRFLESSAATANATFGTWESLGPGNVGGRTRGIVIHPQDPNIMWLGSATGGIWKTTDGGKSWTPLTDFAPVLTVNALVMDPSDPNTLYAGTGEQTQNWRGAGIFKTSDGGQSWTQLAATNTPDFYFMNNLAISRGASSHVYAATNTGVWSSVDGGASWRLSLPSPDGGPAATLTGGTTNGCFDIVAAPGTAADVVFAVCHPPGSLQYAIYRNSNTAGNGAWTMVHADPQMWYTVLAIAPSQPSTIYAISVTSSTTGAFVKGLLAVYRSTTNGDAGTWVTRTSNQDAKRLNAGILSIDSAYNFGAAFCTGSNPNFNGQAGYNLAVAVDPLDPNRVWAAGVGLFRSDDGGANWGYAQGGAHPDQHGLAFDPGFNGTTNQTVYSISDGGIYKTTQGRGTAGTCASTTSAVTWTSLNNGYGTTQFYHGLPYAGGSAYVGGTQDNETVRGNDVGGPNQWQSLYGGDGGVTRVDPVNANTVYAEYVHGALAKSVDGGNSFQGAVTGLNETSLNFPFISYYTFDPNNSLRLYVGGTQLWRTEDGAAHWTAASSTVSKVNGALDNIRAIAVSPVDPNLVLFGMSFGRIFRNPNTLAADGSTAWSFTQPRVGNVSHLEFDPRQPSTIYATYTTFNSAARDQHVYRSTDGGLSWAGIDGEGSTGLPDIPVETVVVDPDDSSRLYAGTDLGVFASVDGGGTWLRDDNPFANAITTQLVVMRNGGTKYLYAFTYGRGVWRVALDGGASTCSYSLSPAAITVDAPGGVFPVDVTTGPGCAWSVIPEAVATNTFASAQGPASGVGIGKVFVAIAPNRATSARSATLLVQDQRITVAQAAGSASVTAPSVPTPALDISPPEVTMQAGDARQFRAIASNLPNAAVRWTVAPQVGVIATDGTYNAPQAATPATVTITAQSLANTTLRATSTVTIAPLPPVSLGSTAVTNGASFQTGPVAPGEVVTIFASGIGPADIVTAKLNSAGRLASMLSGTQVLFDGIPAPLVYVAAQQVSAIVPYEVAGRPSTQMVVVRNGQSTPPAVLTVTATTPSLFTSDASGSGQAAALNQDQTRNGPQGGATPGSIVSLFATGEGQTIPGGVNGKIATGIVPQAVAAVRVQIGGVDAEVIYAGAAPQAVAGLFQVNARIPASVMPGAVPVVLTVGTVSSSANVTITVR